MPLTVLNLTAPQLQLRGQGLEVRITADKSGQTPSFLGASAQSVEFPLVEFLLSEIAIITILRGYALRAAYGIRSVVLAHIVQDLLRT